MRCVRGSQGRIDETLDRISVVTGRQLAALAAKGTTQIGNVEQIDRGYQDIEQKLRSLGAQIQRIG